MFRKKIPAETKQKTPNNCKHQKTTTVSEWLLCVCLFGFRVEPRQIFPTFTTSNESPRKKEKPTETSSLSCLHREAILCASRCFSLFTFFLHSTSTFHIEVAFKAVVYCSAVLAKRCNLLCAMP